MTHQVREILIIDKEVFSIYGEPLKGYLKILNLPHKLVAPSSACWRGYTSKWTIENKKLYLIEWKGYILDYQKVGMEYIFPNQETVFAYWFSGSINIDLGEIITYTNNSYVPLYEGNRCLTFEKGDLIDDSKTWLSQEEIDKILKEENELPF